MTTQYEIAYAPVDTAHVQVAIVDRVGQVDGLAAFLPRRWATRHYDSLYAVGGFDLIVLGGATGEMVSAARVLHPEASIIAVIDANAPVEPLLEVLQAGADACVRAGEGWLGRLREVSAAGVDAIFDPVAGATFDDSVRALASEGRLIVIGFAGGSIPTLAMNRVLFRNIDIVGAAWGAFLEKHPEIRTGTHRDLLRMADEGFVDPMVGAALPLERAADAVRLIGDRKATGKVVLTVREEAR